MAARIIVDALLAWLDQRQAETCTRCRDDVVRVVIRNASPARLEASRRTRGLVVVLRLVSAIIGASGAAMRVPGPIPLSAGETHDARL